MTSRADIDTFVRAVAQQFSPRKIILFGSYAYGTPTPDSDVDLLVIMDHAERNVEKAIEIRSAIRRPFPLDLFVRRPVDIAHRLEIGDSFIGDILHRGSTLYEADHRRVD